ncbi:MAG: sigma-70 family RNA polymerase sigma factor [Myxococcaceae bacterium]|nr:sigma-70 family RNA polymerase sigma factor [Myxococcaceae bacterium]
MARYLADDETAFTALDGRLRNGLRRYFQRCGLDADELSQRTLVQVVLFRHQFRRGDRLRPWVMSIARHLASDQARFGARHVDVQVLETMPADTDVERTIDARRRATAALRALDTDAAGLLLAHHREGYSFHELSTRQGTPVGTLKVRAHRAYRRARQRLGAAPVGPLRLGV